MAFIKKPLFVIFAIVFAGLVLIFYPKIFKKQAAELITIRKGDIVQEVSVTGQVKPAESVDLAFEKSGKINKIYVDEGNEVSEGSLLAETDSSELQAQLLQAQAGVSVEEAKLAELKRGTRPEEIQIQQVEVDNAQTALDDAKKNLLDKIRDAYTKSDDAIHSKADEFFSNPRSSNPQLSFQPAGSSLRTNLEQTRFSLEGLLSLWQTSLAQINLTSDLLSFSASEKGYLAQIADFLANAALALNNVSATANLSQTTLSGWSADLSTARTNVNTAAANLTAAEEKLRTAVSTLTLAQNELALKKAGSTPEDIAAEEAVLKQAQANVASIQAQIAKTVLRSPINGIVTRQDAKVGEIAAASAVLVSINSKSDFEVESNVPEVDIGKISLGNQVRITLDAFPGENFSGKVTFIDPGETVIDGVVNFKIKALFIQKDSRMKSGLTANLYIETMRKAGVLVLPQYAIIENDQGTFVKKNQSGNLAQIPVQIGIRSQSGDVEIISGLSEGDKVANIGIKTP